MIGESGLQPEEKKVDAPLASASPDTSSKSKEEPKTTATKQPTQPEIAEEKDLSTKANEKAQVYIKKVEGLRKRFDSQGSIGKQKADLLTAHWSGKIQNVVESKKQEYSSLIAEQKANRLAQMQSAMGPIDPQIANSKLAETEQEMIDIYFPYEKIIDYCRGLDKIDDQDLPKLEALMEAMSKLKTNPEALAFFTKLLKKEKLKQPDEYLRIAEMINPVDIDKEIAEGKGTKLFESAQMGAIIGLMDGPQRMELVSALIVKKSPKELTSMLEMFMTCNILSVAQVESLCQNPNGKIKIPEPTRTELLNQINQGEISKKNKEYERKVDNLTSVNQGRTAENNLNKAVGFPGLFALTALWGAAVAAVNFQANFSMKDPLAGLTNKGTLLGLAAVAGGTYGMATVISPRSTQSLKDQIFATKDEKAAFSAQESLRLQDYMEKPIKTNPYLYKFLTYQEVQEDGSKKSGFALLQEITQYKVNAKKEDLAKANPKKKDQPVSIRLNYQEIDQKLQKNKQKNGFSEQQKLFQLALGVEQGNTQNLDQKINDFMGCCVGFEISDDAKLQKYIADFNKRQGIESPATATV